MTEATMIVRGKKVHFLAEEDARVPVDRPDQIPQFPDETTERAWWGEHTLSEEFWRNAERVPDDKLPPARAPRADATSSTTPAASGGFSVNPTFIAGLVVGGVIAAGVAWLVYELLRKRRSPGPEFLTTRASHLLISPPRPDTALQGLARLAR